VLTQGYSATYGARPLRRAVQRLIEDPVAEAVLDGYCAGGTLQLDADTSGNLLMRTLT
jgi:ATP-dependent Clp protease ATP-binding subunit ClpC